MERQKEERVGTVSRMPARRPRVALAMQDKELRDALFSERLRRRLEAVADCDYDLVIQDFDAVPQSVLESTEVLLTGWSCPRIDEAALERMPALGLIAHAAGSVKGHVDDACWGRGIVVTNAVLANAVPVAEFSLAQILLAGKSTLGAVVLYRERQEKIDRELEFPDAGNYDKTVGIVGASTIGRLVLDRLRSFDLEVVLFDPTIGPGEAQRLGARKVGLAELMQASDVVSLHAPVLPSTIGMVGRNELAAMRTGSTLINTARGALVDHTALREELISGRLNAFLDVTEPEPLPQGDPLYGLPNVLLTPHIAGSMGTELHRMTDFALTEIERFAAGLEPRYQVRREDLATKA
ncbi:hydroxyacid dehydrogenase [Sinomonas sp. JGH33]|uniref:Hydroxyacid dehydrogenase n=1 Tax=Sinomonas terricola TaxID=3110330 RepID=A0ABU5T6M2_9MICC|nr:hydroxyacid dehydrogenase [Sinomonas sp. JGH33]MEA5455228.1 hydroxyacid dehydrogenase [Sinomonas sp. JGH33]